MQRWSHASRAGSRVAIVLYGSRGDIQPGVCLALELQTRGHRVTVLVPPNLMGFARSAGVASVVGVGLDTHAAWSSDAAVAVQRDGSRLAQIRFAMRTVRSGFAAFDASLVDQFIAPGAPLADADVVVAAPLCQDRCFAIAERLGTELVVIRYAPMSENGVVGAIPALSDRMSPSTRRRSWRLADRVTWAATGWNENGFRRRLGLRRARRPLPLRLRDRGIVQIQAFDPALLPGLAEQWRDAKPVVGFLDLGAEHRRGMDETDATSPELAAWLAEGDRPLFVGFGSMTLPDLDVVVEMVRAGARRRGLRCLVAGFEYRGVVDDDRAIFVTGAIDHRSVLPHCLAAVHHGGAGTTAATLRAGVPALICPVTADQPFWANRVRALGSGDMTRSSTLTDARVDAALASVLAPGVRDAAALMAAQLVAPDKAVAAAADIVEQAVDPRRT
ncbi:MAG: glycosyltransferase [Actinomycetota bacterium]|nr:glycosyltransferase [Actinomycetota bacterium]